jgi:hypothetical protein
VGTDSLFIIISAERGRRGHAVYLYSVVHCVNRGSVGDAVFTNPSSYSIVVAFNSIFVALNSIVIALNYNNSPPFLKLRLS